MRRYLLIAFLVLANLASAQSLEQFLAWANEAKANEDYRGAALYYAELLKRQPGILTYQWELAEAYRLSNQYPEAAELYKRIVSKDLRHSYPDARMYQAIMEAGDLRAKDATKTWEKVLKNEKKQHGYRALKAKNALLGLGQMDSLKANPVSVVLDRPGAPINSCYSEMSPRLHEGKLFFTTTNPSTLGLALKEGDENTYMGIASCEKTADGWGIPSAVVTSTTGFSGNTTFTNEGHLIFSRKTNEGTKLYIQKAGEQTSEELSGINRKGNNTKPMIAEFRGEQTLFFTSDRRGGSGGWDIWYVQITDGKARSPRTVGAPVNTPGNETCPFFDSANNKLYFASDFHPGMGGYDLFSSFALQGAFAEPSNWGYPLNTERDEMYPAFYKENKTGYFSRIPLDGGCCENDNCCPDIYEFQFAVDTVTKDSTTANVLTGTREEVQSKLRGILPIRLYFHNDEPNPRTVATTTRFTYAQTYEKYQKLIPQYVKEQGQDAERIAAINDFFTTEAEGNFAKLNQYLSLLEIILNEGDTVEITIRGFASPLAESDYNVNLSLRRISSLRNYLRSYNNGVLLPYLNGTATQGKLILKQAPYGESTSNTQVSDVVTDLKNSVFSRGAALERRIEVEAIDLFSAKMVTDTLRITENLGTVKQNEPVDVQFLVENMNATPLEFTGADADCGCTTAQIPAEAILPGKKEALTVRFSGKAPVGPFERKVYMRTNGEPKVIEMTIIGTIE